VGIVNIVFYSSVERGHLSNDCRQKIQNALHSLEGRPVKITIEQRKKLRSQNQNAFYWAVIIPLIVNVFNEYGNNVDAEQVHEFLKDEVGKLSKIIILPNGEKKKISGSTAELGTMGFEDYLTKVRVWAGEVLEIELPFPNENIYNNLNKGD
tara:strand:+ start:359 stop:814 length:456 start_codon:yes stop_codon:yes gene_type:complete